MQAVTPLRCVSVRHIRNSGTQIRQMALRTKRRFSSMCSLRLWRITGLKPSSVCWRSTGATTAQGGPGRPSSEPPGTRSVVTTSATCCSAAYRSRAFARSTTSARLSEPRSRSGWSRQSCPSYLSRLCPHSTTLRGVVTKPLPITDDLSVRLSAYGAGRSERVSRQSNAGNANPLPCLRSTLPLYGRRLTQEQDSGPGFFQDRCDKPGHGHSAWGLDRGRRRRRA